MANTLLNNSGLVANNVADVAGRGDYFSAGSGTSESQFLLLLGAFNAYQATSDPKALSLATRILRAVPLLYKKTDFSTIPSPVTATNIFAPHWLFACQHGFKSATVHYADTFSFSSGVAAIPDSFALVRKVFQVASVGYALIYPSPYSPLASGTGYSIASSVYDPATTTTTVTLTTSFTGTLAVIYSAQDGPTISVNEMYEAFPDWRPLASPEIDSACDTYNWAARAYAAAYAVTGNTVYQSAATATLQQSAIVYNIDDSRDWLKPNYQLQPFAQSGSFSFTSMTPAPAFGCDAAGDVQFTVAAGTSTGECQFGVASINDAYGSGDTTQIYVGSTIAQTITVFIDIDSQSPVFDPTHRFSHTLTLAGTGVQLFTLSHSDFVNSASTPLPSGSAVYTFGFDDTNNAAHTVTMQRVRQLPNLAVAYLGGAIPFTANFLGTPASLISWQGPCYTGYQSPYAFKQLSNEPAVATNVQFLADSQAAWTAQTTTHDTGPFAPVFIFDRADAAQYGPPNTWSWNGPDPNTGWTGYQYRPLAELAECISLCVGTESYYAAAVTVANNFLTWTDTFWTNPLTGPPTEFPQSGAVTTYVEVHVPALILHALLFMATKFGMTSTYTSLLTKILAVYASMWVTSGPTTGTFSPDLIADGVFGFQTGEQLRSFAQLKSWADANSRPDISATMVTYMAGLVTYALGTPTPGGDIVTVMPDTPQADSLNVTSGFTSAAFGSSYNGLVQATDWGGYYVTAQVIMPSMVAADASAWVTWWLATCADSAIFPLPAWAQARVPSNVAGSYWRLQMDSAPAWQVKPGGIYDFIFSIRNV